jgi:hypothetical protein
MKDWVKDQFLQQPVADPWIAWTDADLAYAKDARLDYPPEFRRRVKIEFLARQQGKRESAESTSACSPEHKR